MLLSPDDFFFFNLELFRFSAIFRLSGAWEYDLITLHRKNTNGILLFLKGDTPLLFVNWGYFPKRVTWPVIYQVYSNCMHIEDSDNSVILEQFLYTTIPWNCNRSAVYVYRFRDRSSRLYRNTDGMWTYSV